ncbi:MAG: MFS transporter, partial [Thermoguttaceae bacterium]
MNLSGPARRFRGVLHSPDSHPLPALEPANLAGFGCLAMVDRSLQSQPLTGNAVATYRDHLRYALCDAVTGGILATAPVIAKKQLGAPDWQLGLNLSLAGLGMLTTLYLSHWMVGRRKMPFVFRPGLACVATTGAMALTDNSLLFLLFGGLGLMFNTITRPAIAAIVRTNYPPEHRGQATGEIRRWSSLMFLVLFIASSGVLDLVLDRYPGAIMTAVRALLILATGANLAAYLFFRRIQVDESPGDLTGGPRPPIAESFRFAFEILVRDVRYRGYVFACLIYGFAASMYVSYIPAFLEDDLHFGYVQCALLLHVIPAVAAFLVTGRMGAWFDRISASRAWAWVCFGWGLDPLLLALTVPCSPLLGAATILIPVLARLSRGAVQGGYWILWWQIGAAWHAPTGADTSRYQGILAFVDGLTKMLAPAAGAWVLTQPGSSRELLFA